MSLKNFERPTLGNKIEAKTLGQGVKVKAPKKETKKSKKK